MLEAEHVTFSYEGASNPVLHDVSFSVAPGECVGLVGANGAGKSTLLRLFVGLLEGHAGRIAVGGTPVMRDTLAEIRARAGYVFQNSDNQLFMPTVRDDVAFGPSNQGLSGSELDERVASALDAVGIPGLASRPIYQLSGGEKKLAAIATVLAMRPAALLLDEPTSGLDPRNRRRLAAVLRTLPGARLVASHDLDLLRSLCPRLLLLSSGRLVADGPAGEMLDNRPLLEASGL
jgi:cobalt/nickel transport system ATP-binding protein